MVHDQFSIRRFKDHLRQRPRRQKWIEHHQRQASGVVEQNHHQRGCQERAQIDPSKGCKGPSQQSDRCDRQREAQIGKGIEGKVHHVAQGEGIDAGMVSERGRDVPRRGNISHQKKNSDAGESRAAGNHGKNAGSTADPITSRSHR